MSVLIPEKPAPLLARMAEVLYWTGRYLERAEDTARVASVHGETHIDLPVGEDVGWYPLLEIAGSAELFIEQFPHFDTTEHRPSRSIPSAEERITRFVLFDRSNPSSIISSVFSARYNLRQARPVVPREVWELCNELWASLKEGGEGARTRDERVRWLRAVIDECHRINGVLLGTMRRDEALAFLRLGQQVERASMTCRVLAVRAESAAAMSGSDPYRDAHHMAILRSLASYQPFRRATPTGRDAAMLVEFLLQDQHLPRSVNACLAELRELVKALPRNEAVLASCTDTSVMVAAAPITEADPGGLRSFLVDLQEAIGHIHHQIAESYFGAVRAVGTASPGREIDGRPRRQPSSAETSTHDPGILGTIRGMDPGTLLDMQAGMTCRVTHLTTYEYDAPVEHAYNEAHLRPRNENGQQCLTHFLQVDPPPAACSETVDTFGNRVTIFSVLGGFERLSVEATSEVVTVSPRPAPAGPPWESVRVMLDVDRQPAGRDARRYRASSRLVPADTVFLDYAIDSFRPSRPLIEATSDLASRIKRDFVYEPGATSISTPLMEVYENRRGVCQDFAHFMIACVRSIGLAARYVSGYIQNQPPPGQDGLVGSDASHAWVSVFLPGWGWVDIDPTNDQMLGPSYVTTAWGRDYWDVSPLRGSVEGGGGSHRLHVSVKVEAIEGQARQAFQA